jgi:CRP/FNR family cyclic AMP-dependent transcriptional regulator
MAGKSELNLIPSAYLSKNGPGRGVRDFRNKEVIYSQGEPADAVFYIQSGMVKLTVVSKRRRKKAVVALLQEGEFFGEGCLGRESQRMSTATAIGPSTVTRVEKAVFHRKLNRDPAFADMFIAYLLAETARFKADLADHFLNFSERRLARILLRYRDLSQESLRGLSTRGFSQTTLAEMVGTTRARVNGFMNDFREKGYVRYNGGLVIDSKRLTAFLQS